MDKDPGIYVRHILDAITNIELDPAGDRRARQLVERNLEILSEASRRLPKELKDLEADIPWRAVAGIGNILRHDYHETYPAVLWDTCNKDLKPLKDAVERIGRSLDANRNQHRKSRE
jgi:uncharacterized protein with HEPN domain